MKISVCMAVHNGSRFLEEQIHSILVQLGPDDELVVVDDKSTDSSQEILLAFNDPRIRLFNNGRNIGPVKTFERALRLCVGDIIFFSDQDDRWLENKVSATVNALSHSGKPALVSDAILVDEAGKCIMQSFFAHRRSGPGIFRNVYKNTYLGCSMAIDARMKDVVLPFPSSIAQHDEWIGWVCDFTGGVEFLAVPLIAYRRHSTNASQLTRSSWKKILRYRIGLVLGILRRWRLLYEARRDWGKLARTDANGPSYASSLSRRPETERRSSASCDSHGTRDS